MYLEGTLICTSVACASGPSVTTSSTDFFLPKPGFFGIYLNFQLQKITLKINISHILNPNLTESIPLDPQDLSNDTNDRVEFLWKFQLRFNFILSEEIISIFKNFCTTSPNVMEPSPLLSKQGLSKDTKNTNLKHPRLVDLISTKQKQTTFLHR